LNRFKFVAMVFGALASFGLVVDGYAAKFPAKSPREKPMSVLGMLQLESNLLSKQHDALSKNQARQKPAPALLSIYGVAAGLHAVVRVDGHEVLFQQGRLKPVMPYTGALKLRYIKPPCVSFVHGSRRKTLCLTAKGS
jgi:hypothetical protein